MSLFVFVEVAVKQEFAAAYAERLAKAFETTRAFEGCENINAYRSQEQPNRFTVVESWATRSAYEKYFEFRKSTGVIAQLEQILETPMRRWFCDKVA